MLTDNRADDRTQDWFLIAYEGDLVLKLARDLMIGEDERGQTVLSPAREDALLRITSENGCLTLQTMAMDWTFSEEGGLSRQHLTFVEGLTLKLNFPSSSLILTPDFEAGDQARVDREVRLTPIQSPALTLTRVDEPLILMEPAPRGAALPEPDAEESPVIDARAEDDLHDLEIEDATEQALAADVLTGWDHQIPDEQLVPTYELVPRRESAAAPTEPDALAATAGPEPAEGARQNTSVAAEVVTLPSTAPRRSHRTLSGLIAAAALLTPMALYLVEGHKLGVDFPLTNYLPIAESNSTEPATVASVNSGIVVRADQSLRDREPGSAKPSIEASRIPAQAPGSAAPARRPPSDEETQKLLIASLLAEAKAFYNAGLIVTPIEANTVSHLTQVLSIDPTNVEGLRLMYLSAVTLIEEAEAAHAAGEDYLARNLVEDVLGFHPEFDSARVLRDSWTRAPEG